VNRIIECEGRRVAVEIEPDGDGCRYRIVQDGQSGPVAAVSFLEAEPGIYSVLREGRSYEVKITPGMLGGWHVDISGRRLVVQVIDPRTSGRRSQVGIEGRQEISAPMPGKVVRVLVNEGDTVEAGDGLVVVEAMKMQNEMKAPRSGKVLALAARTGATVSAGEVLVTLE